MSLRIQRDYARPPRPAPIKINAFAAFLVTVPSGAGSKLPRHLALRTTTGKTFSSRHRCRRLGVVLFLVRYSAPVILSSAREARRPGSSSRVILFCVVLLGSFFSSLFSLSLGLFFFFLYFFFVAVLLLLLLLLSLFLLLLRSSSLRSNMTRLFADALRLAVRFPLSDAARIHYSSKRGRDNEM